MTDRGPHCPFLDQTDARCGKHFRIDSFEHAFRFCFGRYKACPTYLTLQVEGRIADMDGKRLGTTGQEPPREKASAIVTVTVTRAKSGAIARPR